MSRLLLRLLLRLQLRLPEHLQQRGCMGGMGLLHLHGQCLLLLHEQGSVRSWDWLEMLDKVVVCGEIHQV